MEEPSERTRPVLVTGRREVADRVVELELSADDLPAWEPGAHIDLILPSGTMRQYSLCGDPTDAGSYTIAVLREVEGRGGSQEVHDRIVVGDALQIRGPRNHFPLVDAPRYLFVAGGIGVTALLPMARAVSAAGKDWRLVYAGRSLAAMAYAGELTALDPDRVELAPADSSSRVDVDALIESSPSEAVYTCGPERLLEAVSNSTTRVLGSQALHLERFGADPNVVLSDDSDEPFDVTLARSGVVLRVGARDRLINVVRKVVPGVPFSCEEGYCGSCESGVLAGIPLHRDSVLSDEERAANDTMMICVGRSKTPSLELDL